MSEPVAPLATHRWWVLASVLIVLGVAGTLIVSHDFARAHPVGSDSAGLVLAGGLAFTFAVAVVMMGTSSGRTRALDALVAMTEELRQQALHDALTGLANRALISDRIEDLLDRARSTERSPGLLFIDLDEFKSVNDTLGHLAGDLLLRDVGDRLIGNLGRAGVDTIGRMGGDEFVVLIDGIEPTIIARQILEVMQRPFELTLDGTEITLSITCSIGVASGDRTSSGALLRDADVALYEAKAAGRNCFEVFDPAMAVRVLHRYGLEFDLRPALEARQFRIAYQPIYNLDDLTLVGVEALLRWDHPRLGVVWPDEFIPLLEASGQIVQVGKWVLDEACRQIATWRRQGSDLTVSVNVSGKQLDRDHIVNDVAEAIAASGIDPDALTIEVTETALMRNTEHATSRLHAIKRLGVKIAIDDFGTGYSSLAYLEQFPVDSLKIDKIFTDSLTRSPESDALVHTLVQLAKDLGLETLAEGVETSGQVAHLRGERVDRIQGFAFAKPLDPEQVEVLLFAPMAGQAQSDRA